MDFGSLLQEARRNDKSGSSTSFYKTKFDPPKKETKSRTLSANIQKFLAKKEEEERQKLDEAKKKRDELLALRDEKTKNKIRKTLKTIKSANKSVLDDAVDNNNTSITLAGPDQPDEDDYGYVSQEASALYSKMMEKYKSLPDEEKFSSAKKNVNHDLSSTKDRVKAAILRHQEEEAMPHKRKRRSHAGAGPADNDEEEEQSYVEEKREEKPRPKKAAPPPLDFSELLKLAEKKQFEPVVIETKKPDPTEEPERLMTKKQKREYEQYKAYKEAKLRREQERESNSMESSKKARPAAVPKPEVPSKPINPLSIRIPKVGEKNLVERKPSLQNSTSARDKEGDRLSGNHRNESKCKREDQRPKLDAAEERRISKVSSSEDRAPRQGDRGFKEPASKSSSDRRQESTHKSGLSSSTPHRHSKPGSDVRSSNDRKENVALKKSEFDNKQKSNQLSSSYKSTERKLESQKVVSKQSHSEHPKAPSGKLVSKTSSETSRSEAPGGETKRKFLPQDIRSQKGNTDSRQPAKSSPNTQSGPRPKPDMKSSKPGDYRAPKPANSEAHKSMGTDKTKSQNPNLAYKNVKPGGPSRPLSSSDSKTSKPGAGPNGMRGASNMVPRQMPSTDNKGSRQFPPADVRGARQFPPADVRGVRQFPPSDVRGARQFPPSDVRSGSRQFPPKDTMGRNGKRPVKRRIDDEDSEYDSELDDFIDDGPEDRNDYSGYIKEIFGYDKSKYRDDDEDVDNMESNFSQVMREEFISKKIGLMEDLEDMRLEAMEKKKKMQKKRRRISDD